MIVIIVILLMHKTIPFNVLCTLLCVCRNIYFQFRASTEWHGVCTTLKVSTEMNCLARSEVRLTSILLKLFGAIKEQTRMEQCSEEIERMQIKRGENKWMHTTDCILRNVEEDRQSFDITHTIYVSRRLRVKSSSVNFSKYSTKTFCHHHHHT